MVAHLDTLGRTFLIIADNGADGQYRTYTQLDIEGNPLVIIDARGRKALVSAFDMLSQKLYSKSMDAGERWMLNDVAGKPFRSWDSRGHVLRMTYDALQRPTQLFVRKGNGAEMLVERTVYGEGIPMRSPSICGAKFSSTMMTPAWSQASATTLKATCSKAAVSCSETIKTRWIGRVHRH